MFHSTCWVDFIDFTARRAISLTALHSQFILDGNLFIFWQSDPYIFVNVMQLELQVQNYVASNSDENKRNFPIWSFTVDAFFTEWNPNSPCQTRHSTYNTLERLAVKPNKEKGNRRFTGLQRNTANPMKRVRRNDIYHSPTYDGNDGKTTMLAMATATTTTTVLNMVAVTYLAGRRLVKNWSCLWKHQSEFSN